MTDLSSVPKRHYRVRRRTVDGEVHLVDRERIYQLSRELDRIWQSCDGTSSIGAIAHRAAETESLPLEQAQRVTLSAVLYFERLGFLRLTSS